MKKIILATICLFLATSACAAPNLLAATPTATPTAAPLPTASPASHSTDMPGVPLPGMNTFFTLVVVDPGGFTFLTNSELQVSIQKGIATLNDQSRDLVISFTVAPDDNGDSLPAVVDAYLKAVQSHTNGMLVQGDTVALKIGGADGIAVDLTGTIAGNPIQGLAVSASPAPGSIFFGLGVAFISADPHRWESYGKPIYLQLIQSVRFTPPGSSCVVSTDQTFGYTVDHPIKLGGGDFGGPSRERAYLDHLLGPNGEQLTYERTGSLPGNDTILDAFSISGLSQPVTLYIDEYSYTDPVAPFGFSCTSPFPLSAP